MITRRDFGLMSAGAGISLLSVGETNAQGITTMRLANASGVIDSQVIFMTVGMNPKVGYYAAEKVAMEVTNMSGAAQTMQAMKAFPETPVIRLQPRTSTGVPSASVAVVKDGQIAYVRAYGNAALEPRTAARPQ